APVYWANDLFLRRAISVAADMAASGRTPAPRTLRHGHPRAPLSAARRTRDSCRQARLPIFCDPATPAPPRAALYPAHSSDRPRGAQGFAEGRAYLRAATRRAGAAGIDPRSVEPLGVVHHGGLAVVLVAAGARAAFRAGLSRRP